MSSLKQSLKAAKAAIEKNDPESVLEYCQDVFDSDKNNYFAYIFQGKAYQLLNDIPLALKSFKTATELEPENLLGWKGYFQCAKNSSDYNAVFTVLTSLLRIQVDNEIPIADTLKDLMNWLVDQKYKNNEILHEAYLKAILPGTELAELVGSSLGRPEENVKALLDLQKKRTDANLANAISKERVKFGRVLSVEGRNHLNRISLGIYQKSDLTQLYELLLNISVDDAVRAKYEEDFLKYKYELLQASPEKEPLIKDIKEMVEGMVLVKSKSALCWSLYFDWADIRSLDELDLDNVAFYLKNFQNQGLATVLYAYIMSDISKLDRAVLKKLDSGRFGKKKKRRGNRNNKSDSDDDTSSIASFDSVDSAEEKKLLDLEETPQEQGLLPGEILSLMLEGIKASKDSLLVNRIVCEYYIHLREYSEGSQKCRELIKLLADMQRNLGLELVKTKESVLCSLAIIYTYDEAPKNFPRALELYDRILSGNPNNLDAKVGKGLILIEKQELQQAKALLESVVQEHPENEQALREYGWCLIKGGDHEKGREILDKSLEKVKGNDLNSGEVRSVIHWRLAKSFLESDEADVTAAYEHLIQSLKDFQNYAPSYTLLGVVCQDFYGEVARAQKCFYKAFELDVNETTAAKYLVDELTSKNEWEIAEILSNRLVASESARRILASKSNEDPDKSWPYRVLGCAALNKQDDAKAVEWFQSALRVAAGDKECWIGLGEAYVNCGRLDAAAKVFRHLLTLQGDNWIIEYMLGQVVCQMGEFNEGLHLLVGALEKKPGEECILGALYESYIENSKRLVSGGFFGRAMQSNLKAIGYIKETTLINSKSSNLWKNLGECLRLFLLVQEQIDLFPYEILDEILGAIDFDDSANEFIREVGQEDEQSSLEFAKEQREKGNFSDSISTYIILSQKTAIKFLPSKVSKYLRSVSFYHLGLAYLEAFNINDLQNYRELAVKFFKKSIQLEGNNASYWIGLGNAYVSSNPHISQHCFIKAISLESRDAGIWTNLAALYLRYGDSQLAQEAFLRAQSVAPQESQSWLGHALAAEANGDEEQASRLFTHAFVLSNGRSPLAQLLYAMSIISKRVFKGSDPRDIESAQEFSVANYAMQQYLKYSPNDVSGLQIALTVSERCKNFDQAIVIGERLCGVLEKKYEDTESEVVLLNYARAKTQLARIYLGLGNYAQALENAQFAINLAEDDTDKEYEAIRLSSRVVIGLGLFFNNEFDEALDHLKLILEQHSQSKRMVTLVAQVLYKHGTEETKQAALDQLFAFIEENGSSLIVVLTLGAISVADNLEDYFGAIKEELEGLPLTEIVNDSYRTVPKMLMELNSRIGAEERVWQKSALLFPSDFNVWKQLNSQMALSVATLRETKLTAPQISGAYLASGKLREIQRSLLLSPGNKEGLERLAQVS